ncbi:glycosyltransferase family 4 protein [Litoribacter ruber]|uniref:glycosyltransferase family 4 protein n=1 Tax=Litoribacter ruber TaxID=702568 RepID=UPI001BD9B4C6|nr:glycosyltransferase family 4 protein [Litoribacter ruber]MBT0812298.1 glycosyltransferase family 4 protein [Litoribacter ruber]
MKIAFCSRGKFSLEKGSTKNRIELSESLRSLGWDTVLVDKQVLGIGTEGKVQESVHSTALKEFLLDNNDSFDVVLYEYDSLPFERNIFNKQTLFVARPAILGYHLPLTKFKYNFRTKIAKIIKSFLGHENKHQELLYQKKINFCLNQADLIQVQNRKDCSMLVSKNHSPEKIIVVPNGITPERISEFGIRRTKNQNTTIAFVGTFDFRKGAMDFPVLYEKVKEKFPLLKLKLLGTSGMFYSEKQVLQFFPKHFRNDIEVVPIFQANELPELLNDCDIGVFPSFLESFGFGALEMMCAGLPVIAYDSPGPSDFILPDLLVPTGDINALIEKVIALLKDKALLKQKAKQARETVVKNYCWDDIAKEVDYLYRKHLDLLRQKHVFQNQV